MGSRTLHRKVCDFNCPEMSRGFQAAEAAGAHTCTMEATVNRQGDQTKGTKELEIQPQWMQLEGSRSPERHDSHRVSSGWTQRNRLKSRPNNSSASGGGMAENVTHPSGTGGWGQRARDDDQHLILILRSNMGWQENVLKWRKWSIVGLDMLSLECP